ncbi:MAG: hypothetical protein MZU84_08995 [Sphingobacterium sp.]|nr:hypothetical protein [Sphingobacterium sp.]
MNGDDIVRSRSSQEAGDPALSIAPVRIARRVPTSDDPGPCSRPAPWAGSARCFERLSAKRRRRP